MSSHNLMSRVNTHTLQMVLVGVVGSLAVTIVAIDRFPILAVVLALFVVGALVLLARGKGRNRAAVGSAICSLWSAIMAILSWEGHKSLTRVLVFGIASVFFAAMALKKFYSQKNEGQQLS